MNKKLINLIGVCYPNVLDLGRAEPEGSALRKLPEFRKFLEKGDV